MSTTPSPPPEAFIRVQQEPQFVELKHKYRRFAFPMTIFFLAWYLIYVIVAAFAPQFMAIRVVGLVNIGIIWGLLQFVTTFVITGLYVRYANKVLDPEATAIRQQLEEEGREHAAAHPTDEGTTTVEEKSA